MKYFRARDIPVVLILASALFLTGCASTNSFQVRETAASASSNFSLTGRVQGQVGGCEVLLPSKDANTVELDGELNIKYKGEKCDIDYLQLSK